MKRVNFGIGAVAVCMAHAAFGTATCFGGVVWNESINGELSDSQSLPTPISLIYGANSVIGGLGNNGDFQDWLTFTVPAGYQLTALVLTSYASNDAQGFMGIQLGSSFVGSPFSASSYLGYAHYGTGAVNGGLPPTNLIGANMLPLMGNVALAPGSAGFVPPLGPGTYTLLIQQLGDVTGYEFTFNLVPSPSGATLAALGCIGMARRSRRA